MQTTSHRSTLASRTLVAARQRPSSFPCQPTPLRLLSRHGRVHLRRQGASIYARASIPPNNAAVQQQQQPNSASGGWRRFWTAVDVSAWLGTVGSAVAFLLTQEALLIGAPVLLPLLALYAARQIGQLDAKAASEETRRQVISAVRQVAAISEESAADVADELDAIVEEVRQGRNVPVEMMKALEKKVTSIEGVMANANAAAREAAKEAASMRSAASRDISTALSALRRDISSDLREATGDEMAALGRVDARLGALEGALAGLEIAQSEGIRRLNSSVAAALADGEDAVAAAVRAEVWKSLEPVRALPQMLAAAAPVLAQQQAQLQAPVPLLDEDALREVIADAMAETTREILADAQRQAMQDAAAVPMTIASSQWNQLGKKLMALSDGLEAVKEAALANAASANDRERNGLDTAATLAELAAVKAEMKAMSSAVAEFIEESRNREVSNSISTSQISRSGDVVVASLGSSFPMTTDLIKRQVEVLAAIETALKNVQSEVKATVKAVLCENGMTDLSGGTDTDVAPRVTTTAAAAAEEKATRLQELDRRIEEALAPALEAVEAARQAIATVGAGKQRSEEGSLDAVADRMDLSLTASTQDDEQRNRLEEMAVQMNELSVKLDSLVVQKDQIKEADVAAHLEEDEGGDEDETDGKLTAYQRMQALLRTSNYSDKDADGDGAAEADDSLVRNHASSQRQQRQQPAEYTFKSTSGPSQGDVGNEENGSAGIPIRAWLAGNLDESNEDIKEERTAELDVENDSESASKADITMTTVPPPAAARLESGDTPVGVPGSNSGVKVAIEELVLPTQDEIAASSSTTMPFLAQQRIAFEASLGMGMLQEEEGVHEEDASSAAVKGSKEEDDAKDDDEPQSSQYSTASSPPNPAQEPVLGTPRTTPRTPQKVANDENKPPGIATSSSQQPQDRSLLEDYYSQGLRLLKEGRGMADVDPIAAENLLQESVDYFDLVLEMEPDNVRALGNAGNALTACGKLKFQAADVASRASVQLEVDAENFLILAGRRYYETLQVDASQSKAFLNWGRAICYRAEIAKARGDFQSAEALFSNAAVKFGAALDIEISRNGQERDNTGQRNDGYESQDLLDSENPLFQDPNVLSLMFLKGSSLLSAAECIDDTQGDGGQREQQRVDGLIEAERLLSVVVEAGVVESLMDEAWPKLNESRAMLETYAA